MRPQLLHPCPEQGAELSPRKVLRIVVAGRRPMRAQHQLAGKVHEAATWQVCKSLEGPQHPPCRSRAAARLTITTAGP